MLQFLLGIFFGIFVILPLTLIASLCYFPMKVQHGFKKAKQPHITPPPGQKGPYLYKLFPQTQSTIGESTTYHTNPATNELGQTTTPKQSTPKQSTNDFDLLTTARDEILTKLSKYTSGETLHWFNLFIITATTSLKTILTQSDDKIVKLCQELGLSPTGTNDTAQYALNNNSNNPNNRKDTKNFVSSGSSTLLPILNRILIDKLQTVPFLGPTRVTYMDFRSILPQINNIHIIDYDVENKSLVFDITLSLITDSVVEVDLSVDLQYENLLIATMPTQIGLTNIFVSTSLRIALDLDFSPTSHTTTPTEPTTEITTNIETTTTQLTPNQLPDPEDIIINEPSISISLLEPPVLRFDLATQLGYNHWLSNLPFLHTIIHKGVMLGASSLLAPNYKSFVIPPTIKDELIQQFCKMATNTTSK
jgi:hypothetical protein